MEILMTLFALGFMNKASYILPLCLFVGVLKDGMKFRLIESASFIMLVVFSFFCFTSTALWNGSINLNLFLPPMAFGIGSIYQNKGGFAVSKVILIFAYAMAGHVMLNFVYEMMTIGTSALSSPVHIDIWSRTYSAATGVMVNATILASQAGCILLMEQKKHRWLCGLLAIGCIVYNTVLGGRSFFVLLICGLFMNLIGIFVFVKERKIHTQAKMRFFLGAIFLVLLGAIVWATYSDKLIELWENSYFYHRFFSINSQTDLAETGRWDIGKKYLMYMWDYPWGGRQLYQYIRQYAHQLWLDVLDIGGIIPFAILVLYTIISSVKMLKYSFDTRNREIDRVSVISFWACMIVQFFLEPIISGAPILFCAWCMVHGTIVNQEKTRLCL